LLALFTLLNITEQIGINVLRQVFLSFATCRADHMEHTAISGILVDPYNILSLVGISTKISDRLRGRIFCVFT